MIADARVSVRSSQMRLLAALGGTDAARSEAEELLGQFAAARSAGTATVQDYIYTLLVTNFLVELNRSTGQPETSDAWLSSALAAHEARPAGYDHLFLSAQLAHAQSPGFDTGTGRVVILCQ